jgi:hypothetical protein
MFRFSAYTQLGIVLILLFVGISNARVLKRSEDYTEFNNRLELEDPEPEYPQEFNDHIVFPSKNSILSYIT